MFIRDCHPLSITTDGHRVSGDHCGPQSTQHHIHHSLGIGHHQKEGGAAAWTGTGCLTLHQSEQFHFLVSPGWHLGCTKTTLCLLCLTFSSSRARSLGPLEKGHLINRKHQGACRPLETFTLLLEKATQKTHCCFHWI